MAEAEVVTEPLDSVDLPHADPPQGGLEIRVNKDVLEGGRVRLSITVPQSTVSHYWNVAVAEKQDAKKSSLPPKKQVQSHWRQHASCMHVSIVELLLEWTRR